nr:4Fe-4S binding protein [Eggerthella sinensis]
MKRNAKLLRTLSAVAVIGLVCLGLALHTGTGTPSAWGIYDIAALCPLGAVEAALAGKTVVPPMLIALVVGVVLVIVFGRAFCAWGCPVPLLRRLFGLKSPEEKRAKREGGVLGIPDSERGGVADSRNWILGGTVLSAAVFGFPVFCLICPVGLTFATIVALWRLFQFNEVALSLLVFPAMLVIEVVVLRKWCSRFCPLGALLSLVARLNRTFRPRRRGGVSALHEGRAVPSLRRRLSRGHRPASSGNVRAAQRVHEVPRLRRRLPDARHRASVPSEKGRHPG